MSAPWRDWQARAPSAGFPERVASAARRAHVTRRRARLWAAAGVALGVAAAIALVVGARARHAPDWRARAAIARDEAARLSGTPFQWPSSPNWDGPAFTFPLAFAPSLPYRGGVVLHTAPEFDRPGTPDFWSYVAVWVTNGREPLEPSHLEQDLRAYYTGLCGDNRHRGTFTRSYQVEAFAELELAPLDARDRAVGGATALRGKVSARDCEASGGDLVLNVEAVTGACDEGGSFVAYALSPRPYEDPIWDVMRSERRAFRCKTH